MATKLAYCEWQIQQDNASVYSDQFLWQFLGKHSISQVKEPAGL
jgi:hypothetical protein